MRTPETRGHRRTITTHGLASIALCVGILPLQAFAQSTAIVGPQRQVNAVGDNWRECSVAARVGNENEVVFAANSPGGGEDVSYAITRYGGLSFTHGSLPFGLDPAVTVDPLTDRLWITALGADPSCSGMKPFCMSGAWKEPGADTFDPANRYKLIESCHFLDRPTLRVLSTWNGRHLLTYIRSHDTYNCLDPIPACPYAAWSAYSGNPYDKVLWPDTQQHRVEPTPNGSDCHWEGWGATPVELDDGRVVVVVRDHPGSINDPAYNNDLPYVAYSDDGGIDWKPENQDQSPVRVADGANIVTSTTGYGEPGDTPLPIDRRARAPGIAVNRTTSPNDVYVVFYARAVRGDTSSGDRNADIYISRSTDRGETFPSGSLHLLQLTDAMLTGQPGGDQWPDQVMPSIAIDSCGGINIVFYDNRHDPTPGDNPHLLDLYYVRITGFGTPSQAIQQVRLTPQSFLVPADDQFLGHYQHMAFAPPRTVYPAYVAIGGDGVRNCYTHKIRILCSSDLNSSGGSDGEDVSLFQAAYGKREPLADLNRDGQVDEKDEAMFWDTYVNGCGAK